MNLCFLKNPGMSLSPSYKNFVILPTATATTVTNITMKTIVIDVDNGLHLPDVSSRRK
jgi:hypothetical protein